MLSQDWMFVFHECFLDSLYDDPDLTPTQIGNDMLQGELVVDRTHHNEILTLMRQRGFEFTFDEEAEVTEVSKPSQPGRGAMFAELDGEFIWGYFEH